MFHVTFYHPSGNPPRQVQFFRLGDLVLFRGQGTGLIENNFPLVLVKNIISRCEIMGVGPRGESGFAILVRKSILLSQVLYSNNVVFDEEPGDGE